ncbi:RagB/SusD family nutrient uptake outer membrane protein, partial [Capnocytophaga canis]
MKRYTTYKIFGLALALSLTSCMKDLDQSPIDPDSFTQVQVFANPTEAKSALAKVYASYALTGQQGPQGQSDITGIDEGYSQFSRLYFAAQELTTETALVGWADQTIKDFHALSWSSSDMFLNGLYNRLGQQISFANSFITNAEALSSDAQVRTFIAEARFLRAYSYYCLMDLFANVPLATKVQATLPTQSNRQEIFQFVESELKAIEGELKAAKSNEYGRVDAAAAQALLSRLYLNAKTWVGTERYADCVAYAEKVINSGYALHNDYRQLFMADNDTNGAQNEFIFVLNYDGIQANTWGGVTNLLLGSIGG